MKLILTGLLGLLCLILGLLLGAITPNALAASDLIGLVVMLLGLAAAATWVMAA